MPCDDFYRFACGNFLRNTDLPADRPSRSVQDISEDDIQLEIRDMLEEPGGAVRGPFDLAKTFYRACMNETAVGEAGLSRMKEIFREIGGWPSLDGDNWRESQFDWKEAVHKLRMIGINFDFFFTVFPDVDKRTTDKYILVIHDPFYSPSEISHRVRTMYLDYMVKVAVSFGVDDATARRDQNDVLTLLLKLAKISEESRASNKTNLYNPLSISELKSKYPSIPWFEYINGVLAPVESISYDDVVSVAEPVYLTKVGNLLRTTPKRKIANFMAWHTLQYLINYLPAEILDRAYEYLQKVNGKIIRKPRWNACVKATEDRMNAVVSAAYIDRFFDENIRRRVIDLIGNIKLQFKYNLLNLNWMDEEAKKLALEKLESSAAEIVSYEDLMESSEENSAYEGVEVNESKLLQSALNLDVVRLNLEYGKLRKEVKHNWMKRRGFITGLNIVYLSKKNVLKFPVGVLRGIYYRTDRPEYMNYGILGSIVAHEISHVFMAEEHDGEEGKWGGQGGKLRTRWSADTLSNYRRKLQCLSSSNQQGKLATTAGPSKKLHTHMADLAGMKVAYDAYINAERETGTDGMLPGLPYTPRQLFWISSAVRHCSKYSADTLRRFFSDYRQSPQQFRVNGPLRNLKEFAADFGCPLGSGMNPRDKCYIW